MKENDAGRDDRALPSLSSTGLGRKVKSDSGRMPLHARVREYLRGIILEACQDGDKFFPEPFIIEQLGVSQGTVRRALTDLAHEGLLVRKVPSGTFVRKRNAATKEIHIIMPGCDSVFLMGVLEHVLARCHALGVPARIHHAGAGAHGADLVRPFQSAPDDLRILLLGVHQDLARSLYRQFSKRGIRVVNVDTLAEGCGDAYVGVDNADGIRQGMEHLVALGHRRILLLVNEPMTEGNIQARVNEFKAVARGLRLDGASVEICRRNAWRTPWAKSRLQEILAGPKPPTAIFTVSDTGAWVTLKALADLDVPVPGRVSVLGFDDDRASAYMQPALSTLAQPVDYIARRAIERLVDDVHPVGDELLPSALVVRESTGPAPKERRGDSAAANHFASS